MFLHNKRMMYQVRVDQPNPAFAKMLLEQFGGPNGELAAAMRYFTQGWNEPDEQRRSMMLDIATRGALAPGDGGPNPAPAAQGLTIGVGR
jgi:Mn-containing catalase